MGLNLSCLSVVEQDPALLYYKGLLKDDWTLIHSPGDCDIIDVAIHDLKLHNLLHFEVTQDDNETERFQDLSPFALLPRLHKLS